MGLIAAKCFGKKWYEAKQRECGQLSPNLLETANHAFEFLAELAKRDLPFVFKGGTCILLLVDDFRRLSIDVDIALPMSRKQVLPVLESIIPESRFLKVEPLDRDPFRLPKRHHYRILYESVYTQQPGALLVDILEDDAHYPKLIRRPIAYSMVEVEEEILVSLPTIEGLLGDKLTAFAPTTIGIRYDSRNSGLRIAKQICDIGELTNKVTDLTAVKESYQSFVEAEANYREEEYSPEAVAQDRLDACNLLCRLHTKFAPQNDQNALVLKQGVRQLESHMVGRLYSFDNAKVAAAKAAALTTVLHSGTPLPDIVQFLYSPEKMKDLKVAQLQPPLEELNILKRAGNAEAFYYWLLAGKASTQTVH